MPPYIGEIMIGRVSFINQAASGILDVGFSSYQFPLRNYEQEKPVTWRYYPNDDFGVPHIFPKNIHTDSLVIALSDVADWGFPYNYSIFHITTLSCDNDIISLGLRDGTIHGWNRKKGSCNYQANSLLDVFIEGDEKKWLQELRDIYPTCDSLEKAFPLKQDILMINNNSLSLENDVTKSSTGCHWLDWILSKIDAFFRLF
ncbi:hypothetical protein K2X92_05545 [Candidatus Gracilibacteria bacterium]|nr:hypothetical protein [Candidatus Gracilibacteria bacterium]